MFRRLMSPPAPAFYPRRLLVIVAGALLLALPTSSKAIDLNGNGLSDIWELAFQAQGLNPQDDTDGDGMTNLQESLAGTNPFSATSRFAVTRVEPATGGITLHWPSAAGKVYHIYASGNLKNWNPTGNDIAGTGGELQSTQTPNNNPKFYRVQVSDVDTDGDGLSDWEEIQLGWNPNNPSTDGQQNDYARAVAGLQATTNTISVTETDPTWSPYSATPGTFLISRSGRLDALTINLQIGGTATPGVDYQTFSTAVSLPLGASSVLVTVAPLNSSMHTVVTGLASGGNYQIGSPNTATMTLAPGPIAQIDSARFLTQSTFGATNALLAQLQQQSFVDFLSQQFNTPATPTLPRVDQSVAALPPDTNPSYSQFQEAWWYTVVNGPDQLRQRVAFALSELMVASCDGNTMNNHPEAMATYWDLLTQDAFGNFRQLLQDVTLNPAMGDYLDMVHNDKPDPANNTEPNENYGREIMQLFTIGLNKLNQDGSLQLDNNGQPIPTYDQDVVEGYSHLFTGWYWYQTGTPKWTSAPSNYRNPMLAFPDHHDTGAKQLLNGVVLPANQTQAQDLQNGLDVLFNHPNVPPFVSRRLIQRLVTSNPSPAYISRIAQVFINNGQGVRGDLKAVIQAILLDTEARSVNVSAASSYGHEREPVIRLANLYRAFNASAADGTLTGGNQTDNFAQSVLYAPSVFNFFAPDYMPPGTLEQAGLFSPEFYITTDSTVISSANKMRTAVYNQPTGNNPGGIGLDLSALSTLSSNPAALVDSLNYLLMAGEMSNSMRDIVVSTVSQIPAANSLERAQTAVHLLVTSPEFVIQK
jgi:uncharacterized protein (DUF1800 family)